MDAKYLKQGKLDALKSNIQGNIKLYQSSSPWLDNFFGHESFALEADVPGTAELELKLPSQGQEFDLENTRRVYSVLKNLTRAQAADERLWAYMTHVCCWEYMRLRWPVEGKTGRKEGKDTVEFVRGRYFFMSNRDRALLRNGLARLWWYGYVSYDPQREDAFELTSHLLHTLDITQSLLERSFSRNENITRGVLRALADWTHQGEQMPSREQFRSVMQYLTLIGGVTVLDMMGEQEIGQLVRGRLEHITTKSEVVTHGG